MSVPYNGGYYRAPQIDFNWLSQAWGQFRAQAGAWIGAMALFLLVVLAIDGPLAFITGYAQQFIEIINSMKSGGSPPAPGNPFINFGHDLLFSVCIGIVNSILLGGLYRMAIRQGRGETIKATDIFSALNLALPLIAVGLMTQLLMAIGSYICIVPYYIVGGLFMFAPIFVIDRQVGPFQAITESVNLLKSQWLMVTLFYFVAELIGGVGALVFVIGIAVTYPIMIGSIAQAYLVFTQPMQPEPFSGYGTPQPGVWPPPPGSQGTPPPYGGPPAGVS